MEAGKNAVMDAPADQQEDALPASITAPYFSQGFKEVLTTFVQKLLQQGVPRDKLNKALAEMLPEIQRVAKTTNSVFTVEISKYLSKKKWEEVRSDYLGRALIMDLESFFPHSEEIGEKLKFEPVENYIPREVAEGLITALKGSHGTELIHQYEEACSRKKEQYRHEVTRLIDMKAFMEDAEVKSMVKDITTRFKLLLHKKTEPEQRKWLNNLISRSHTFKEMKRDLTEKELDIVARFFLKTKH